MHQRERLEKTLLACRDRVQEEVAALIGKPFRLGEGAFRLVAGGVPVVVPADRGRVLVPLRLDGEIEGAGLLLLDLRDAVRLSGLLIMLPEAELQAAVAAETWSDELADTFAEVATIVCTALSAVFAAQFPRQVRFLAASPLLVPAGASPPVSSLPADDWLFMTLPMEGEGFDLGAGVLALAATPFGMAGAEDDPGWSRPDGAAAGDEPAAIEVAATEARESVADDSGAPVEPVVAAASPAGRQRTAQRLLTDAMVRLGDALGNLLGGNLRLTLDGQALRTREEALGQAGGRQALARLTVGGEGEGEACVLTDFKAAVALGSALVMLPPGEQAQAARGEGLDGDLAEAWGEVINITASVLTAVFAEQDEVARLHFDRGTIETVVPTRVSAPQEVLAAPGYWGAVGRVQFTGKDLGRLRLFIPATLLGLELPVVGDAVATVAEDGTGPEPEVREELDQIGEGQGPLAEVLVFTDDREEGERYAAMAQTLGCSGRVLHFKDPVRWALAPGVRLVFLVMREVSELGFGVAIKLASAGLRAPLVAAGPAWTRSLVLQAVKYGVSDILVTPVTEAELRERLAAVAAPQVA